MDFFLIWIWLLSQQGSHTGASHLQAVMCEQLAQGYYLIVEWPRVEPSTSRSLGLMLWPLDYQAKFLLLVHITTSFIKGDCVLASIGQVHSMIIEHMYAEKSVETYITSCKLCVEF